jgi:hypothetical protein
MKTLAGRCSRSETLGRIGRGGSVGVRCSDIRSGWLGWRSVWQTETCARRITAKLVPVPPNAATRSSSAVKSRLVDRELI